MEKGVLILEYSLITSQIFFDIDEILEILEEYIGDYVLIEHYFEDYLVESKVTFIDNIDIEADIAEYLPYFKQKYSIENIKDQRFLNFIRNNFLSFIYINDSMVEIEVHNGKLVCLIGSRGEVILRTGPDSYVFSPLFNIKIKPDKVQILLESLFSVLNNKYQEVIKGMVTNEMYTMSTGVCIMAIAKINELPLNNYELNLSHDEMLLFGLAINLASEYGGKEFHQVAKNIMEQIKDYFPEIEHISPESFESTKMGKVLDFKRKSKQNKKSDNKNDNKNNDY